MSTSASLVFVVICRLAIFFRQVPLKKCLKSQRQTSIPINTKPRKGSPSRGFLKNVTEMIYVISFLRNVCGIYQRVLQCLPILVCRCKTDERSLKYQA